MYCNFCQYKGGKGKFGEKKIVVSHPLTSVRSEIREKLERNKSAVPYPSEHDEVEHTYCNFCHCKVGSEKSGENQTVVLYPPEPDEVE